MKIILLSITVAILIIGIHQTMMYGFTNSYWLFMLAIMGLLGYQYMHRHMSPESDSTSAKAPEKSSGRKKIKKIG